MNKLNNSENLLESYAPVIGSLDTHRNEFDRRLLMANEGGLDVYYAPFDYIEKRAKVVLVGITPGQTQMLNALKEASRQLSLGTPLERTAYLSKRTASFSGAMRNNLIKLLDNVRINEWLGIESTKSLFEADSHLVHYTSVLRYPVFYQGKNYSGSPSPDKSLLLAKCIKLWFEEEVSTLQDAIFIPLGNVPRNVLRSLSLRNVLPSLRILDGLPHPSGANAERIAYFLGNKPAEKCSVKCDTKKLDASKAQLFEQVSSLIT